MKPDLHTQGMVEGIVVFLLHQSATCAVCGSELTRGCMMRLENEKPHCLDCAKLGALVFLPRGDATLSRRSRKHSGKSAVVVEFSRSRGRYERQGLLVEPDALERAQADCQADADRRRQVRIKATASREKHDVAYVARFGLKIRELYPGCPPDAADAIAAHACEKHSGRVGRAAAAKEYDPAAIGLAVRAYIRHQLTDYDRLLARGADRAEARAQVAGKVSEIASRWARVS